MTNLSAWKRASAVFVLYAATAIAAHAQTFSTLASFGTDGSNALSPYDMSFVQGADGKLYGTTSYGGTYDYGTVFRFILPGTITTLYSFCAQTNCSDGSNPGYGGGSTGLVLDADGDFYGATPYGGNPNCYLYDGGCGTIFQVTSQGQLTTLHTFNEGDGARAGTSLLQGFDSDLFGVTQYGGNGYGEGVFFKITTGGTFTVLYSFCETQGCPDGAYPNDLILGRDGNFYGTAGSGGTVKGGGTVFKLTPDGTLNTLYNFCGRENCPHGSSPLGLLQATDGDLYGATYSGGNQAAECGSYGCGTLFRITPSGKLVTIYRFCSQLGCPDGGHPLSLVQATDGNLYGVTELSGQNSACYGSNNVCGTIFKINSQGVLTTLHIFCSQPGCPDGYDLYSGRLLQATDGKLYGTTSSGGSDPDCSCGTIFSLDMGLSPFVALVRRFGKVGQTGGILGQGFTGTTSVSFNGIPANFTVKADTFLEATVPAGGTTGYVTVITPSGTLTSNVPFHVIK